MVRGAAICCGTEFCEVHFHKGTRDNLADPGACKLLWSNELWRAFVYEFRIYLKLAG